MKKSAFISLTGAKSYGSSLLAAALLVSQPVVALAAQDGYVALKALYDQHQYPATVANGSNYLSRASKSDPEYRRIQNLTMVAANRCQPLLKVSSMARDTYNDDQENPVAAANFGALQMQVGDRELAGQLFQKAIQKDPTDFFAHVGLAEALALDPRHGASDAVAELAKAEAGRAINGHNERQKWSVIGNAYMTLNHPGEALTAFLKAEKYPAENALAKKMLDQCIYRASLASGQTDEAKKLMENVLVDPAINGETIALTVTKLCPAGPEGDGLARRLYKLGVNVASVNPYWYYPLGRAFAAIGQEKLAAQCLESAAKNSPNDAKILVADAAALARCNQNVLARRRLLELSHRIDLQEPRPESQMMQGLAKVGLVMLSAYESNWASAVRESIKPSPVVAYKTAYADVKNLRCHCHLMGMQHTMRAIPGVVFAFISDDRSPVAMIIYDSKKVDPESVWPSVIKEGKLTTMPRSETVSDFSTMVQLALDFSEARYQPEHPYFSFDPLPLELNP